ncbi:MAG: OPT/YSL family transporter [Bdellovibrionales bacterium]|nr:OPT/YSL family transporter [Bdellovibrionales bacterium]
MAIQELTTEQVHTMTLVEKDQWWLTKVYRGDMPQLNVRSALTGMLIGGVLSLTNLYVGIKTGWTLGVGITSVILSFAFFKAMAKLGIGKEMTILENNAMQSVATSAGYMTAPLIASMPAFMMVTGKVVPMWQTFWWIIVLSLLGVLFAFPLKKRFINEEQLPFPEGRAAGIVLDNLHTDEGQGDGIFKAKLLAYGAGASALVETMRSEIVMGAIKAPFLKLPDYWDDLVYKFATPAILGTPLKDLTIRLDSSIVMVGTGGLMNMKTAMSLLLGAFVNYFLLAPILIKEGIIAGANFKAITMWSLWTGASMMASASLFSFFSKPKLILESFTQLFRKVSTRKDPAGAKDPLGEIELPMWIFVVGIPLIGAITVYLGHVWFDLHWLLGLIAIPLVFVFTLIAVTSTGLTAITPGSALSKLTQITYSVIAPGNIGTNLMTAGITTEVSLNASNLLMDIKPGYMLGGKPRHQAVGHVLGIFAGALVAVPVYYQIFHGDISLFTSDKLPMPGAAVWKAVAEVLTKGLSALHPTAVNGVIAGVLIGVGCEIANIKTKGKFPISGVGLGLAFVLKFADSFSMALGALFFFLMKKKATDPKSLGYRAFVKNQETVCAGVIAGGSIIGIILIILENVVFAPR